MHFPKQAPSTNPPVDFIDIIIDGSRVSLPAEAETDECLIQWIKDYCTGSVTPPGCRTITHWIIAAYEEILPRELLKASHLSDGRVVYANGFAPKSYRDGGRFTYYVKTSKPQV